jgi:hypothetical protein
MEEDFCLLGLVSDDPDYKLCWRINQSLDTNFEKSDDLKLFHRKLNDDQLFSLFEYEDEDAMLNYRIIKNRSDQGFYLDEIKNIDFLVHIQGEVNEESINRFMQAITMLSSVRMCVPVDLTRIRNMERLLLW